MTRALFPHQTQAIESMLQCESRVEIQHSISKLKIRSTYGMFTNPIGSGKTLTTLSLMHEHPLTLETCKMILFNAGTTQIEISREYLTNIESQRASCPSGFQSRIPQCRYLPYQVVVCTKPLVNEWINEADRSGIPIHAIQSPTMATKLANNKPAPHSIIVCYPDVLFKTLASLNSETTFEGCFVLDRVIFDDIHMNTGAWKNVSKYSMLGLFTWFLSATPNVIDERNVLKRLQAACSAFSQYSWAISTEAHVVNTPVTGYVDAPVLEKNYLVDRHTLSRVLSEIITPEIQNMLDVGDFDGIKTHFETTLGKPGLGKPIHELVLEVENKTLDQLKKSCEQLVSRGMNLDNIMGKIDEQTRKINGIKERLDVVMQEAAECPICMCDIPTADMAITPCCHNMLCKSCVQCLFQTSQSKPCPVCRETVKKSRMLMMTDHKGSTFSIDTIAEDIVKDRNDKTTYSSVFDAIEKIIMNDVSKKYIIFTETEDTVSTYQSFLKRNPKIKLTALSGRLSSMRKNIENLRDGTSNVLFLNSESMEAGLNLQFVDEIVIVGRCDPNRLKQAIGRVRRYPRTEPVLVNYVRVNSE